MGPRQALETALLYKGSHLSIHDGLSPTQRRSLKPVAQQVSIELNLLRMSVEKQAGSVPEAEKHLVHPTGLNTSSSSACFLTKKQPKASGSSPSPSSLTQSGMFKSKYATPEQPYGPYADGYCAPPTK